MVIEIRDNDQDWIENQEEVEEKDRSDEIYESEREEYGTDKKTRKIN